ncbi:MAG: methionine--tRNA ligase [Oligoflexia bacterium]|nr:methionine--tRNA ligase [Oligoflexia bacterium]
MAKESFYVTTPIYYVNDIPHLGTAYCTIAADVLARFERLMGADVRFLTGTDEHGEKVQEAATKKNKSPQEFTDEVAAAFKTTWEKMGISFDDFIRTTEDRHKKVVQYFIKKSLDSGDIYLGNYEGWYCVPDETFWTESQLKEKKCPTCGRDVKKIKEENYFFKIGKYVPALLKHIEDNPTFILPESKKNEVVSFLKEGVRDVSVSRTSFTWGIPFPEDEKSTATANHVIYVWFDALINYVSALNPLADETVFKKYWGEKSQPKAIHLIGKDILRFHAVYWPCLLLSVGFPLPKRIFAHGWWTIEGQKMSKSLGNAIEPIAFTNQYGQDAFRLFLFREFPFGQDGDFNLKNFKDRVNADLANNLGNLVSRTTNLIKKNLDSKINPPQTSDTDLEPVLNNIHNAKEKYLSKDKNGDRKMELFDFHDVLQNIFPILLSLNKYIDTKAPWTLAKDPTKKEELSIVLNNVAEGIRIAALFLWPFIPTTSTEILKRLGQKPITEIIDGKTTLEAQTIWGRGIASEILEGGPLFPRLT